MLLREDKTLETVLMFVGVSIGLCALPALCSRLFNFFGMMLAITRSNVEPVRFWLEVSGLGFSGMLFSGAGVCVFRPKLVVLATGSRGVRATHLGSSVFWLACVRAVGVGLTISGFAWLARTVFRYKATLGTPYLMAQMPEIRSQFVGSVLALFGGVLLAWAPRVVSRLIVGASSSGEARSVVDRQLLTAALRSAGALALAFRAMWLMRFATWAVEDGVKLYRVVELTAEVWWAIACFWLMRRASKIAERLRPTVAFCQNCRFEFSLPHDDCPECGQHLLHESDPVRDVPATSIGMRRNWIRIVSIATVGWWLPVAFGRGQSIFTMLNGVPQGGATPYLWSLVMGAGAPVLVVCAMAAFVWPGLVLRLWRSQNGRGSLYMTGLRCAGLAMLGQALYQVFLPIGYWLSDSPSGRGPAFYPSGVTATVQLIAAFVIAVFLLGKRDHSSFAVSNDSPESKIVA